MKNNILNFVLAGLWIIAMVFNIINKANWVVIGYNVILILYFLVIGIAQCIFEKQGDAGKLIMRKIYIAALIGLFALVGILTFVGLR